MPEALPANAASEVQKLAPDALVSLYCLDTTVIGGGVVLYWTPSVKINYPNAPTKISFGGHEYTPYPIEAEGFEWRGKGPAPRPRIRVSNIDNIAGSLVVTAGDMVGAKITRIRTFAKFLDGWPNADPNSYIGPDIWYIERKVTHNPLMIEWELSSILDQQGRMLPGRTCMRDVCTQTYREWDPKTGSFDYTGVSCPYTADAYFTEDGKPTTPERDACGRRLSDCQLRANAAGWQWLYTWAFPGMGRI